MKRFLSMLLTAAGLGMIVGGISFTPEEPFNPNRFLEVALQSSQGEKNLADLNHLLQLSMQQIEASPGDSSARDRELHKAVSSALKGIGTALLVFGALGLALPFLHRPAA